MTFDNAGWKSGSAMPMAASSSDSKQDAMLLTNPFRLGANFVGRFVAQSDD
jgi:hypothetical protein